jgi:hypothetical protein
MVKQNDKFDGSLRLAGKKADNIGVDIVVTWVIEETNRCGSDLLICTYPNKKIDTKYDQNITVIFIVINGSILL